MLACHLCQCILNGTIAKIFGDVMQLLGVRVHAGEVFRQYGELCAASGSLGEQKINPGQIARNIGAGAHLDDGGLILAAVHDPLPIAARPLALEAAR